jgi:hypothetical protein
MAEILDKAKPLAQATGGSSRKDAVADWLWGNLNLVLSRRSKSNRTI